MIELFEETGVQPTVAEVAERAGISPRSVFRYFDDVDALTRAAIDSRFREAISYAVLPLLPDDLDARIDVLITTRANLYDFMGSTTRLVRIRLADNPLVAQTVARSRNLMRMQLREVFGPELDALGGEADMVLDLLDVLFGPESWTLLLETHHDHVDAARVVLAAGTRRLLGQ